MAWDGGAPWSTEGQRKGRCRKDVAQTQSSTLGTEKEGQDRHHPGVRSEDGGQLLGVPLFKGRRANEESAHGVEKKKKQLPKKGRILRGSKTRCSVLRVSVWVLETSLVTSE